MSDLCTPPAAMRHKVHTPGCSRVLLEMAVEHGSSGEALRRDSPARQEAAYVFAAALQEGGAGSDEFMACSMHVAVVPGHALDPLLLGLPACNKLSCCVRGRAC